MEAHSWQVLELGPIAQLLKLMSNNTEPEQQGLVPENRARHAKGAGLQTKLQVRLESRSKEQERERREWLLQPQQDSLHYMRWPRKKAERKIRLVSGEGRKRKMMFRRRSPKRSVRTVCRKIPGPSLRRPSS